MLKFAQRRFKQLQNSSYEEILAQLKTAMKMILTHRIAACTAKGAHIIDNGKLPVDEAVTKIIEIINS